MADHTLKILRQDSAPAEAIHRLTLDKRLMTRVVDENRKRAIGKLQLHRPMQA